MGEIIELKLTGLEDKINNKEITGIKLAKYQKVYEMIKAEKEGILTALLDDEKINQGEYELLNLLLSQATDKVSIEEVGKTLINRYYGMLKEGLEKSLQDKIQNIVGIIENLWRNYNGSLNEVLIHREELRNELDMYLKELGYNI
jgi:type I restriction enzyme M protein